MNSLVLHGYHQKGLINVNDLSIDGRTVVAKKGGRRLATTVTTGIPKHLKQQSKDNFRLFMHTLHA
jgi:hypothetical protein